MSYILDALRKSEEQRRLASAPDLGTEHRPAGDPGRGRTRLWMLLGAGLLLNAFVVGAWLLRSGSDDSAGVAPPAAPAPAPARAEAVGPAAMREDRAPSGQRDPDDGTAPGRLQDDRRPGPASPPGAATAEPTEPTEPTEQPAAPAAEPEPLPASAPAPSAAPVPIRALPDAFRQRIGPLSFSTHIYADEPRFREVAINGRTHREGARIGALRLVEITEDGVILELEGRRFSVSVMQDWDY